MIHPATLDDIPVLIAMFEKRHQEMNCKWEINVAILSVTFNLAVSSEEWLCLIDDDIMMLAVSFISPLGAGMLAQELCMCATPGTLNAILDAYEEWARTRGCRITALGCEQRHETFARLYGRRGYSKAESTFSKVL